MLKTLKKMWKEFVDNFPLVLRETMEEAVYQMQEEMIEALDDAAENEARNVELWRKTAEAAEQELENVKRSILYQASRIPHSFRGSLLEENPVFRNLTNSLKSAAFESINSMTCGVGMDTVRQMGLIEMRIPPVVVRLAVAADLPLRADKATDFAATTASYIGEEISKALQRRVTWNIQDVVLGAMSGKK